MVISLHTHPHTCAQAVFPHLRDPQSTPLQSLIPAASASSVPPSSPSRAAYEQWPTNPPEKCRYARIRTSDKYAAYTLI